MPRTFFEGLAGWRPRDGWPDLAAGVMVAAIALPEQMATARLGHFPPELGLVAFVAATLGFVALGRSRTISFGADSTITPIFAAGIAQVAAHGAPTTALAGMLALLVGGMLILSGALRLGWISNLLSVPVTAGFLAGIAVHIVVSQLPSVLALAPAAGSLLHQFSAVAAEAPRANPYALAIGIGVLAITLAAERLNRRIPGALVAIAAASIVAWLAGLERRGVAVLPLPAGLRLHESWTGLRAADIASLLPLAVILWVVVMVQTAATARAFPAAESRADSFDRDLVGAGGANLVAALAGTFPVNASPPRTAVASEGGARSQLASLVAATAVASMAIFGGAVLHRIPEAAVSGVLLFVACRITRLEVFATVFRQSRGEFLLMLITLLAIVLLPIQIGVALGILLSVLHGMWTATRTRLIELTHTPGTTLWWPRAASPAGETIPGVRVLAFQAPLSFFNAEDFRHGFEEILARGDARLIVLEASSNVEVDYTAAQMLSDIVRACGERGVTLAIARLESLRAAEALGRFGVLSLLGESRVFRSVDDAVKALGPRIPS